MSKKIVFMGTPNFAVPILKNIFQNGFEISAVYTQPPKKSDRGQKITKSPIHILAETLNLEVRTPKKLKDNKEEYEYLKKNWCKFRCGDSLWSNPNKRYFKFK